MSTAKLRRGCTLIPGLWVPVMIGCSLPVDFYREDGPSTTAAWESPTVQDVRARYEPAETQHRDWPASTVSTEAGVVYHRPLYFEDPFEDKGSGRTDETHPHNVYRLGWEDWVAFPYSMGRAGLNTVMIVVSPIVTLPWMVMESDGEISQQLIWYDHDATPQWLARKRAREAAEKAGAGGKADAETP